MLRSGRPDTGPPRNDLETLPPRATAPDGMKGVPAKVPAPYQLDQEVPYSWTAKIFDRIFRDRALDRVWESLDQKTSSNPISQPYPGDPELGLR